MGNINAKDPDYWNVPDDPGTRNTNWMCLLSSSKLLSEISVPGTHDTMAREGGLAVWCQSLSLNNQMKMGTRFFDIRCRHYINGLPIHHGPYYQQCNFTICIREMVDFLESNQSEALLVRVKEEYDEYQCTRSFGDSVRAVLQRFPRDRFWFQRRIPTVGEAAGKIVILQDFSLDKEMGIPYDSLKIADKWNTCDMDAKWDSVKGNLDSALSGSKSKMYLTFNSASGLFPRDIARRMNPRLHGYVKSHRGRLGIIAVDYPGPDLIQDIINTNF